MQDGSEVKTKLGIGLLPARYDEEYGFGHMWLYWIKTQEDFHPPYRGFYPDENAIPLDYQDYSKWPRFFARQSVPGQCRVDVNAVSLMQFFSDKILTKQWPINHEHLTRFKEKCFIPRDQSYVYQGQYSWNKRRDDWHNCSSWVISVVNYVMDAPRFIVCTSPKRLGIVERELWGIRDEKI